MKRRLALVWILALVSAGCDADPTELESPGPTDQRSASLVEVGENQFAVDFSAYEADQRLWEADWTRIIQHWTRHTDAEPLLGDWRALDHSDPSFTGRLAALLETPLDDNHSIALRWDALPILEPPLEILVHLWLPPEENHPQVGIAWFIPEPDETGMLSGWALARNPGSITNRFYIRAMYDGSQRSLWSGAGSRPPGDGFGRGGWTWIRLQHTVSEDEGTIRYRIWQGDLEDEPAGWFVDMTSHYFGREPYNWRGEPWGPGVSGKAGLYVSYSEKMAGVVSLWGAFTVGINGAPAPPPPGYSKASLVLDCEPERPTRGTNVTCTASAEPQGAELEVTGWRFTSEDGQSIPAPEGQGGIWAGDMVVSGTVTVEAIVDGKDQEESVQVKVDPRDWHDGIPPPGPAQEILCPASGVAECPLDYPPTKLPDLGASLPIPPTIHLTSRQIPEGPNWGYSYLTEPAINYVGFATYLNAILFEDNSKFWRDSECERLHVLSVVREHEAAHIAFFFDATATDEGTINLNGPFEKLVHFELLDTFHERAKELAVEMRKAVYGMMASERVTSPNDPRRAALVVPDCHLAF